MKEYFAIDREPVGMHVEKGHEYRQLYGLAVQILLLEGFLEGNYGTVGRCHDGIGPDRLENGVLATGKS